MATNKIKIVQGNDLPLCKKLTTIIDGEITPVDINDMTELKVLFGTSSQSKATEVAWTDGGDEDHAIIHFRLESTQIAKLGTYNIWIVGKYGINDVVVSYGETIEVIEWSAKSTAGEYIYTEEQALDDSIFIPAGMTDEELERLKQVYAEKIEEAEQAISDAQAAKEEWESKAEQLEDVAQETNATSNKEEVLRAIDNIPQPTIPTDYAKEQTLNTQSAEIKTAIAKGGSNPSKDAFESRQRLQPYLTSIEYDSLGYEEARARLIAQYGGACTCVWKDGKMGRNYDYNLNHAMDYLLRVKSHNGRAASIGLASVKQLTKDNCDTYSDEYKYLPFRALDGMNEHGLCAAILLLNTNVHSANGSTPSIEERETVSATMLDRYILDSFKTATEAVESIANYVRVKPIRYEQGGETVQKDVHFMVADKTDCYALEFIGTEVVATHLGGDGELPAIMANFLVDNLTLSNGEVGFDNLEDYAQGVERYQIAQEYLQGEGELLPLMSGLLTYTHLYTDGENKWLTDCSGDGVTYKDTDELLERWQDFHDAYDPDDKEAMREDGSFWHTVHSVVYDLEARTMQIVTQESGVDNVIEYDVVGKLPTTKDDLAPLAKEGTVSNGFRNLDTIIREAVSTIKTWVTNKTNDILSAIRAIPEPDLSAVAKEATLTAGVSSIEQKIDAIPAPDLSQVAKQGNNPNVSLSSMDGKLGNVVMMTDDEKPYALADLLSKIV